MAKSFAHYVTEALALSWLTGPVFDKELRVSSRRRRNYVLRFIYLAALTAFVALIWMETIGRYQRYSDPNYQIQRMSEAGKAIILLIVWFQFVGAQVLAVIMLSNAISDEIQQKTLGVLMTTPVTSFQVVLGKMLSKLLQVLLLVLISVPLLAVVRVLGGVPWGFLMVSLCMTVACVLFVGSLSLFLSIFSRHAYLVIVAMAAILGILYLLVPLVIGVICDEVFHMREREIFSILAPINPYLTLAMLSDTMVRGRPAAWLFLSWEWPCLLTVGGAFLMLLASSLLVRKAALQQATGQPIRLFFRPKAPRMPSAALPVALPVACYGELPPVLPVAEIPAVPVAIPDEVERFAKLRTVTDPPVLWKELRNPLIRTRRWRLITIIGTLVLLGLTYILCGVEHELHRRDTHTAYAIVLLLAALGTTAVFSATTITSEKEARSWELLLLTAQGDWQIVLGKFVGAMVRCLFFWVLLFGHVALFTAAGFISLAAAPHLLMIAAWSLPFLASTGVFFSSVFRRTTSAVIMNLGLAVLIWAALPGGWAIMTHGIYDDSTSREALEYYMNGNPVFQVGVIVNARSGLYSYHDSYWGDRSYRWADEHRDWNDSTLLLCVWAAIYCTVGLGFLWLTKTGLRRRM